jgi:hypothetical protein
MQATRIQLRQIALLNIPRAIFLKWLMSWEKSSSFKGQLGVSGCEHLRIALLRLYYKAL